MASSSSSSPLSSPNPSASSNEERLYDVFLTYQTRCKTIASLETSLRDAAIRTFIDQDEEISPRLLEAIEQSRIVILVLTKHFGASRYCLDKIDIIINWHKNMGKNVLPIYCGVSLSDVRQEVGSIAELMSRGDLQKREFFRWRSAFTEATSLSSCSISSNCCREEATKAKVLEDEVNESTLGTFDAMPLIVVEGIEELVALVDFGFEGQESNHIGREDQDEDLGGKARRGRCKAKEEEEEKTACAFWHFS
ncbi:disease resistance protein RUN1-like [Prosopis cineraria]|uniref:disease resistance protein RUN1-like n=1 Tax=Prosopis cineraria TaxID=364024 RepID=UPI00240FD954|nr:disease resistance protein RUN1-like [Prosopis cineraria]